MEYPWLVIKWDLVYSVILHICRTFVIIQTAISGAMLMAGMEHNVIWQLHIVNFTHWLRLHSIKGIKSFRLCLCQCILNSNDILHEHDLHICLSKLTIIGLDHGLSPGRRKAIIWTNAGILLIRTSGTNFSEIFKILSSSFKKMHFKMSSAKWRPFYLGLNVLIADKPPEITHRYVSTFRLVRGPWQ